jgi:hypothetical protein
VQAGDPRMRRERAASRPVPIIEGIFHEPFAILDAA